MAELILSLLDLLESEGRLLRYNILRTLKLCGLLVLGVFLLIAAVGFFIASLYTSISLIMPAPLALTVMGIVTLALSLLFIWMPGKKIAQKKKAETKVNQ